jgi:hypothetical protein
VHTKEAPDAPLQCRGRVACSKAAVRKAVFSKAAVKRQ